MNPVKTLWNGKNKEAAARRDRIAYPIAVTIIVMLLPLLANELSKPNPGLDIQILCIVLLLAINGIALFRKKHAPIAHALIVIPIAAGMVISLRGQGFYGVLFCYPAVVYFYSVLQRQIAHACVATLFAITASAAYAYIGIDPAIVFGMTLLLTVAIINIVFNALSDMTEEMPVESIVDPLTTAIVQHQMERHLREAIKTSKERNSPLSGLRIELDHYRHIQRLYGQETADNVLKGAAFVIRNRLRDTDFLFRHEESGFFALLTDTAEEDASSVSEQLRSLILKAELIGNGMGSVSIGAAGYKNNETLPSWLEAAEALVKIGRNNGGNQVACRCSHQPDAAAFRAGNEQTAPSDAPVIKPQ